MPRCGCGGRCHLESREHLPLVDELLVDLVVVGLHLLGQLGDEDLVVHVHAREGRRRLQVGLVLHAVQEVLPLATGRQHLVLVCAQQGEGEGVRRREG